MRTKVLARAVGYTDVVSQDPVLFFGFICRLWVLLSDQKVISSGCSGPR